jgi:hypothetical protein
MGNANSLARILSVYRLLEQLRTMEVREARSAHEDVQRAEKIAESERYRCEVSGRTALLSGDGEGRAIAAIAESQIASCLVQLGDAASALAAIVATTAAAHRESHLDVQRLEQVVTAGDDATRAKEDRQAQADADDRYGSRLVWVGDRQ